MHAGEHKDRTLAYILGWGGGVLGAALIAALWIVLATGDPSPAVKLSGDRPAATKRAERQSAGDMTPPPAASRDCPRVDMTPPAPRPEMDTTRQPPRADDSNIVTLPNARGTTSIPGPVGNEWTKWVRVPTRAGRTLRPHSEPAAADWVQESTEEDSEGFKWVHWKHKPGAIRAERVVLVVE